MQMRAPTTACPRIPEDELEPSCLRRLNQSETCRENTEWNDLLDRLRHFNLEDLETCEDTQLHDFFSHMLEHDKPDFPQPPVGEDHHGQEGTHFFSKFKNIKT